MCLFRLSSLSDTDTIYHDDNTTSKKEGKCVSKRVFMLGANPRSFETFPIQSDFSSVF